MFILPTIPPIPIVVLRMGVGNNSATIFRITLIETPLINLIIIEMVIWRTAKDSFLRMNAATIQQTPALDKNVTNFYGLIFVYILVLERTPKYRTSNTPNIECLNIELSERHILAQNRTSNMSNITKNETVRKHRTVCSKTS